MNTRLTIALLLSASALHGANVAWTRHAQNSSSPWPGGGGASYSQRIFDPYSGQTIYYGGLPASAGIYSTDIYFYKAATNAWTYFAGTGSLTDTCNDGSASPVQPWPSDRHPAWQWTVDTRRHVLWLYGGVCNTVVPADKIWQLHLNSDPTTDRWTFSVPATKPVMGGYFTFVYDPDDDVVFAFGYNSSVIQGWLYCPTDLNPTPGTLTSLQTTAGCVNPDDWNQKVAAGVTDQSPSSCGAGGGNHFTCGFGSPGMFYDVVTKKVILWGGINGDGTVYTSETWKYDVPSFTWTKLSPSGTNPVGNPITPFWTAFAYNTQDHKGYLHVTTSVTGDWVYDPVANSWAALTSSGTGGTLRSQSLVYDPTVNSIVGFYEGDTGTGNNDVWVGALDSPTSITSLTIQETLYPGSIAGVARTLDPVTVGLPLALAANYTNTNQLGLAGTSLGQFRVLGCWSGTPTPSPLATSCTSSGAIKWVLVDAEASLVAGGTNTGISLTTGGGNFGGSNMAVDNGTYIIVDTGPAVFKIKKASFNGIDSLTVNGTTVISSGASDGLVLVGPVANATYPGNVTCSPNTGGSSCATVYKSSNDPSSTCIIEENGPVKSVLKCTGQHIDGASHAYMRYTIREYFYSGKTSMKVQPVLQNADFGASNTFATAFKGVASYEMRLGANISSTLNYSMANHTGTPTTGTMSGSDEVTLFQGQSQLMQWDDCHTSSPACADLLTTVHGYAIKKNGSDLITPGTETQYPQGWADISNGSGVGVQIGVEQLATKYPVSLEFDSGGSNVRIGFLGRQNNQAVYQSWPQWNTFAGWFNFHSAVPSSLPNEFLSYQHFLIARAPYTYYNAADVFMYQMPSPAAEDNYYTTLGAASSPSISPSNACCIQDLGTSNLSQFPLSFYKDYSWPATGAGNQAELRWSNLLNWIKRGMPGRYLDQRSFYTMMIDLAHPASDGFTWRSHSGDNPNILDGFGQPNILSANNTLAFCGVCGSSLAWIDWAHGHGYGVGDYYNVSGDELIKDSLVVGGWKDYFLPSIETRTYQAGYRSNYSGQVNTSGTAVTWAGTGSQFATWWAGEPILIQGVVYQIVSVADTSHLTIDRTAGTQSNAWYGFEGGMPNSRAMGVMLMWYSRFYQALSEWGDTDAATVIANGQNLYGVGVKPKLCASGYPAGCTVGTFLDGPWMTQGVSPARGFHYAATNGGHLNYHDPACSGTGVPFGSYRGADTFLTAVASQGTYELRKASGTGWSDYWNALDLSYGMSQWMLNEVFHWDGTSVWFPTNGFGFQSFSDVASACDPNYQVSPTGVGTVWAAFLMQYNTNGALLSQWQTKFNISLQRVMSSASVYNPEYGDYQMAYVVNSILNPGTKSLQSLTPTVVENSGCAVGQGAGHYCVTWTTPAGTDFLRVKYDPLAIVEWIGFDAGTLAFTGNPVTTQNWFAATNASSIPSPVTGSQSMTVNAVTTGLTASNFSVKAMAPSGCGLSPSSLGSWTNTQASGFGSLVASGCSSSSYACTGLPTGLSINSSTGAITGTISAAGTFSTNCTYSTASMPYTIIVNAVPSVTTSGAMASGTQSAAYGQSISTSGGTPALTCALFSGSLTGSGLTVNSNCTVTGTAATPATYTFTVKATDGNGIVSAASSNITITVNSSGPSSTAGTVSGGNIKFGGSVVK